MHPLSHGAGMNSVTPSVRHHRALPHAQVAGAMALVRESEAWLGIRLLFLFLVLTAVRTNEARGAAWS